MSFWDEIKKYAVEYGKEMLADIQNKSAWASNVNLLAEEYESLSDYELRQIFENSPKGSDEYYAAGKVIKQRMGR